MLSQHFNQLIYDYRALLFLLICLIGQFLGWRMWLRRVSSRRGRWLVHGLFILFNLGWFFSVSTLFWGDNLTDFFWSWIGRPSVSWQVIYLMGILPLGLVGCLLAGLINLLAKMRAKKNGLPTAEIDQSRRELFKNIGTIGSLGILGLSGYGILRQASYPEVNRVSLAIDGLPGELDGFVIAQLSDMHVGLWASQKELDKAVSAAAAEKPHLVALTGDLVDRNPDFAKLYYKPLERLAAVPYGVWAVLGNHDHYAGPVEIARALDGRGLNMLVDSQVNIPGLPLSIIGLDDQGIHHSWLGNGGPSLTDRDDPDVLNFDMLTGPSPRPGDFTILLNHRPEGFAQAARHGCRLYLAGHTHGGQYQAPWNDQFNLAAAFYKYSSGLYHEHEAWLNVSKGLAAVGIPFRLWAWPEINIITLRRK